MTSPTPRPIFDSYALPLPRRREGSAAALSVVVHVSIAALLLWRGAVLFEARGGGGGTGPRGGGRGGGRQAMTWVALSAPPASQSQPVVPTPAPAIRVPNLATPITQPVKLSVPPPTLAIVPPTTVGTSDGTTGGPGEKPGSGGGAGTGTGTGAGSDAGPGSGGSAGDIFGPTPLLVPNIPSGVPPKDKINHEVRFWIRADGHVTRIDVMPPIRDSDYRRVFMEYIRSFVFSPAKTRDGRPIDYEYSIIVTP